MRSAIRLEHVLRYLVLIVPLVVMLFPLYWMVNTSLKPASEIFWIRRPSIPGTGLSMLTSAFWRPGLSSATS